MTPAASEDPLDLQSLGARAEHSLQHPSSKVPSSASSHWPRSAATPWIKGALLAGVLVLAASQGGGLRRQVFGVSQAALNLEAQAALASARAAVEQHFKETGAWPDRVPLAALDALVSMERTGSEYRLAVRLEGKAWTMDQTGKMTSEP